MALIGGVIKKAIDLNAFVRPEPNPYKAQRTVLMQLLKKAKLTAFGMKHKFGEILQSADPVKAFQDSVPVFDYDHE